MLHSILAYKSSVYAQVEGLDAATEVEERRLGAAMAATDDEDNAPFYDALEAPIVCDIMAQKVHLYSCVCLCV